MSLADIVCVVLFFSAALADANIVETVRGRVRGTRETTKTPSESGYHQFLGIPYAEPPIGRLRFLPPEKKTAWPMNDVLNATEYGSSCTQLYSDQSVGSEDCLYVNVFTPALPRHPQPAALNAVMVFIHGGGFMTGSGNGYAPDNFIDRGVLLVTFNYRLGPFGFYSTAGPVTTGNMGLKDQLQALHWVNDNIEAFGGDPKRVTIFGQGAGATSVHLHMLSPLSYGMFSGAIAMGSSSLDTRGLNIAQRGLTQTTSWRLTGLLGCANADSTTMLSCLQGVPSEELLTTAMKGTTLLEQTADTEAEPSFFSWTVDQSAIRPFLPQDPLRLCMLRQTKDLPFMTGITEQEGAALALPLWSNLDSLNANWSTVGSGLLFASFGDDIHGYERNVANAVKQFYIGADADIDETKLNATISLFTDWRFGFPVFEAARYHMTTAKLSPTFLYELKHRPSRSFASVLAPGSLSQSALDELVAVHGDDLHFLFYDYARADAILTDEDEAVSEQMLTYWTQFAKTGHPTPYRVPDAPPMWKASESSDAARMVLGVGMEKGFGSETAMHFVRKILWQDEVQERIRAAAAA